MPVFLHRTPILAFPILALIPIRIRIRILIPSKIPMSTMPSTARSIGAECSTSCSIPVLSEALLSRPTIEMLRLALPRLFLSCSLVHLLVSALRSVFCFFFIYIWHF
jgi:hypothetical protein